MDYLKHSLGQQATLSKVHSRHIGQPFPPEALSFSTCKRTVSDQRFHRPFPHHPPPAMLLGFCASSVEAEAVMRRRWGVLSQVKIKARNRKQRDGLGSGKWWGSGRGNKAQCGGQAAAVRLHLALSLLIITESSQLHQHSTATCWEPRPGTVLGALHIIWLRIISYYCPYSSSLREVL